LTSHPVRITQMARLHPQTFERPPPNICSIYNYGNMDANRFQRIAKALADPRRFEIFEEMAASGDELACGRIVERFPVAQATVSHHLKELTDAGLIEMRPPPIRPHAPTQDGHETTSPESPLT